MGHAIEVRLRSSLRRCRFFLLLSCLAGLAARSDQAPAVTAVTDPAARQKLLGPHKLTLQWISWDHPGAAEVTDERGVLRLKGEQRSAEEGKASGDYLKIDGVIAEVAARSFVFDGRIETRVYHIADGKPCVREGRMTFHISGKRRYWRLKEMDNPCEHVTDYVDLYF